MRVCLCEEEKRRKQEGKERRNKEGKVVRQDRKDGSFNACNLPLLLLLSSSAFSLVSFFSSFLDYFHFHIWLILDLKYFFGIFFLSSLAWLPPSLSPSLYPFFTHSEFFG